MAKAWVEQHYTKYFLASVLMHVFLLAFFVFSLETSFNDNQLPPKAGEIVQATIVDQTKIDEEVVRLKTVEKQQSHEQEMAQKQLTQKLEQVKHEREQEQAKLEKLKKDMAIAKQQEQKQLDDLKREKETEKKRLAALDDQRQAEQDRVKQMRQEREKEEKKKQDAKRKAEDAKRLAAVKAAKNAAKEAAEAELAVVETQARDDEVKKIKVELKAAWEDKIRSNKRIISGLPADLLCTVSFRVLPDGNVYGEKIIKSSGNKLYDDSVLVALHKSVPFMLPDSLPDSLVPLVREEVKSTILELKNGEGV